MHQAVKWYSQGSWKILISKHRLSHKLTYPLIRNSVYRFNSAYVHEFEDKSLLLIATEHMKIEPKNVEDYREYVWAPKIESIKRPVQYISLQGVITTIHSNLGGHKELQNPRDFRLLLTNYSQYTHCKSVASAKRASQLI